MSSPHTSPRTVRIAGEELEPVRRPPSLTTINGFGFRLYGRSDHDPATDSYMTTHYLVALFLPLLPIGRYRVQSPGHGGYRFLGRGRLRDVDKLHVLAFAAFLLYLAVAEGRP